MFWKDFWTDFLDSFLDRHFGQNFRLEEIDLRDHNLKRFSGLFGSRFHLIEAIPKSELSNGNGIFLCKLVSDMISQNSE